MRTPWTGWPTQVSGSWATTSTDVFCYPTCHRARAIPDDRLVRFRSGEDALLAGYRGCPDCRPVDRPVFRDD